MIFQFERRTDGKSIGEKIIKIVQLIYLASDQAALSQLSQIFLFVWQKHCSVKQVGRWYPFKAIFRCFQYNFITLYFLAQIFF